jgi:predicted esterase
VLTLHGLKPYDNAYPQVKSWQQEADRYRFIVIAPVLRTCDSLTMQYPLRDPDKPYVRKDCKAILAILDEVCRRTNADPNAVLSTSFSSGGYMAHYLVNRYPERFSCLAVRGSNFNAQMLDTTQIPKYRDMPIAIFFGENDFKDCRRESMEACQWYRKYRFDVEAKRVAGLGHQRRPQTAAAFFAKTIGVQPKTPPDLGSLVLEDVILSQTSDTDQPPTAKAKPKSSSGVLPRMTIGVASAHTGADPLAHEQVKGHRSAPPAQTDAPTSVQPTVKTLPPPPKITIRNEPTPKRDIP